MKQIKKIVFTVAVLVVLTACGAGKETNVSNSTGDDFKKQYLNIINQARSKSQNCGTRGIFPATKVLTWNEKLYNAAYEHSNDMAITNTFSHAGSGQASDRVGVLLGKVSSARERIDAHGYKWSIYAENIGAGTNIDTVEKIVSQLLGSDGHCANIMNPLFREVGMAMVKNSNSQYTHYWTQNFGTPLN